MPPVIDAEFVDISPQQAELYPDRRGEVRFVTVYRLIKVEHGDDEGLGRCRNISDGGAKVELNMDLGLNSHVTIAFSPTQTVKGRVAWVNGHEYGIVFDAPIDCMSIVGQRAARGSTTKSRAPRLKTRLPAWIAYEGGTCRSIVSEISVRGMRIASATAFTPGLRVRVILAGGRECEGVIRWSRDNIAGLMLLDPIPVEDLGSVRRLSSPTAS
jgi:hypothetical protein